MTLARTRRENGYSSSPSGGGGPPPFSPADVSPFLWINSKQITPQADGSPLVSWSSVDGSSTFNNIGGSLPTYRTASLNGLPCVEFNGIDQTMHRAEGVVDPGSTFAIYAVISRLGDNTAEYRAIISLRQIILFAKTNNGALWGTYIGGYVLGETILGSTPKVIGLNIRAVNDVDISENGVIYNRNTGTVYDNWSSTNLGQHSNGGYYFTGRIGELVVSRNLVGDEPDQMVQYMMSGWNVV